MYDTHVAMVHTLANKTAAEIFETKSCIWEVWTPTMGEILTCGKELEVVIF